MQYRALEQNHGIGWGARLRACALLACDFSINVVVGVADTCRQKAMEFGISLDPLAVVQRHALYDSESDEESEQQPQESSEVFTFDGRGKRGDILKGKTLLVAVGGSASVFVRSFVRLREEPLLSLQADVGRVEKGSHFPKGNAIKEITVFRDTEENTELLICTHPTELTIEFCNKWTEKVISWSRVVSIFVMNRCLVKGSRIRSSSLCAGLFTSILTPRFATMTAPM